MKIGVLIESFKLPFKQAIQKARSIGVSGVQIYAKNSPVHAKMTNSEISEVKKIIQGEGIEVSALCGDFGCRMFYFPNEMRQLIEDEKRVMDIAKQLGTDIVTTHIGVVPDDFNSKEFDTMHAVCHELARHADENGGRFAVETGPEPASRLKAFLDTLQSKGVSVNFDPANLVMVIGEDIVSAVHTLKDYIVHTHAKDGKMLKRCDPKRLYIPSISHVDPADFGDYIQELPLGEGDVSWDEYIAALRQIGYDGYLTIEREVGENPSLDIELAVKFLNKYV